MYWDLLDSLAFVARKMKRTRQLLLVLGVLVMVLGRDLGGVRAQEEEEADDVEEEEEVDESRALLVVWKRLKEDTVVEGKEVEVEVTIYNMGSRYVENWLGLVWLMTGLGVWAWVNDKEWGQGRRFHGIWAHIWL